MGNPIKIFHFRQLNIDELYDILKLRQDIFIVEQNCLFSDADVLDKDCYHGIYFIDNRIVATSRILPKGLYYKDYASIGRICCHKNYRGKNIAKGLIEASIEFCRTDFHNTPIKISAQAPLINYYSQFGFKAYGEEYLEDDIIHRGMILPK